MKEIKIYIESMEREEDGSFDLKKYSQGEYKKGWFTLPVNKEEIQEKIGVDIDKDEYCVMDYEADLFIPGSFRTVEQCNELYEKLKKLDGTPLENHIAELQSHFIPNIYRLIDAREYFKFYPGYSDFKEFARDIGMCEKDIEASGWYLMVSDGIFEYKG